MSNTFQTAVRKDVPREQRQDAINRLSETGDRRNLAVLVQMGGLNGEFRRRALEALIDRNATEQLESLAEDHGVDPSLRRRAGEVV